MSNDIVISTSDTSPKKKKKRGGKPAGKSKPDQNEVSWIDAIHTLTDLSRAMPEVTKRIYDAIDRGTLNPLNELNDERYPITSNLERLRLRYLGDNTQGAKVDESWFGLDQPSQQGRRRNRKPRSVRERTEANVKRKKR